MVSSTQPKQKVQQEPLFDLDLVPHPHLDLWLELESSLEANEPAGGHRSPEFTRAEF